MDTKRFVINVYSHGIHVRVNYRTDRSLLRSFYDKLSVFDERFIPGRGRVRMLKNTYATYHGKDSSYGLHRNHMMDLLEHLKRSGVLDSDVTVIFAEPYKPQPSNLVLKPGVALYDYQEPIHEFLQMPKPTRVLPLQTGKGKTAISLFTIAHAKVRAAVVMGAMHIETWIKDSKWMFEGEWHENIVVVKGSKKLRDTIRSARKGKLTQSIILISITTLRRFLSEHEKEEEGFDYGCTPLELYKVLGVGIRITDEAHENLHFNFRHDIETTVPKAIFLSATLKSNDNFVNGLYETIYPIDSRYEGLEWDKYIKVDALGYGLKDPTKVRYKAYGGRYNHIVFEEWIMADKNRLRNYFDMIQRIIEVGYLKGYQEGMKCLIFFGSKQMCEVAALHFKDLFPNHSTHAYTGDHDSEILHSNDIVCTTLGSSGTGKDIKGLRTVILTTALFARERNIQVLGRLRKLEEMFPGVDPKFYYLVCRDIDKHMQYHRNKVVLFKDYAKEVKSSNTNFMV